MLTECYQYERETNGKISKNRAFIPFLHHGVKDKTETEASGVPKGAKNSYIILVILVKNPNFHGKVTYQVIVVYS